MYKNKHKKFFMFLCFFILFFINTPKTSYAFLGIGDISLDPVQDVEGGITSGTTGISAVTNTLTSVFQGSQFAKEFVGDSIANFIAKTIIQRMTAQTVNWINTGFKGNPVFVTNPDKFFLDTGDNIASYYLSLQGPLNQLCSPFKAKVRLALVKNYLQETNQNYSCTLGKIEQNFDSFTNDFNQGGWDTWFNVTQNSQSNPYGSYLDAKNQLSVQIGNDQNKYQKQLDWGKGILSYDRCTKHVGVVAPGSGAASAIQGTKKMVCTVQLRLDINNGECPPDKLKEITVDSNGNEILSDNIGVGAAGSVDDPDSGACLESETVTPGSVINDQLSKALGSTWSDLEAADEINEIVGALMQQLVSHVVGGISSGLRGLSSSNSAPSTASSRTFLQQMIDATSSTSPETKEWKTGQESLIPSDLGGTAPATPKVHIPTKDEVKADQAADSARYTPSCTTDQSLCTSGTTDTSSIGTGGSGSSIGTGAGGGSSGRSQ